MKKICLIVFVLCCAAGSVIFAQNQAPPTKVGIINIQAAIIGTQEGQKAAADLQARYEPIRKELEKKQNEIQALRDQLARGANTMSEEAKEALRREIDQKTRAWNRDSEDASADFQADQQKILQTFFERMQMVIDKYARDNGYALILDISSEQSPVIYATNAIDITNDIIALYDKSAPPATSATQAAPSAAPTAAKPAAAPAKK